MSHQNQVLPSLSIGLALNREQKWFSSLPDNVITEIYRQKEHMSSRAYILTPYALLLLFMTPKVHLPE